MMSVAAFIILFFDSNNQWLQDRRQLYICNFVLDLKRCQVSPPLNARNNRKFLLKYNLFAKYVMRQIFWLTFIVSNGVIFWASVTAYLDPDSGFTILGMFDVKLAPLYTCNLIIISDALYYIIKYITCL